MSAHGSRETTDRERPWLRECFVDGEWRNDASPRTRLVEHYAPAPGRTFLDLGAGDAYESRALAQRGAKHTLALEGKGTPYDSAVAAQEYLRLPNHEVRQLDVRRVDEYGLGVFDVVLCFNLLYHMANPFNLLKRIRAVTGELLLLDTHVAPLVPVGIRESIADELPWRMHELELDGVRFRGRIVPHLLRETDDKGGLDNPWAFWLTPDSVIEAVTRAGFRVEEFYTAADEQTPEPFQAASETLRYGDWNTKVWIVASPRGNAPGRVAPPTERILGPVPEPLGHAVMARAAAATPSGLKNVVPLRVRMAVRKLYAR